MKREWIAPVITTEVFQVGVFGNYSSGNCGNGNYSGGKWWYDFWKKLFGMGNRR